MTGGPSIVKAAILTASQWLEWSLAKLRLKNAPEIQANASAKADQQIKDEAARLIAQKDAAAIREELAE